MEHRWNYKNGKSEGVAEKPVPVPLYPPQIPHRLAWDDQTHESWQGPN